MPKAEHCRPFLTMLERTTRFYMDSYGKRLCFIIAPCYCLCRKTERKKILIFKNYIGKFRRLNILVTF